MRFIVAVIYLEYFFNSSNNGDSKEWNKFIEPIVFTRRLKDHFLNLSIFLYFKFIKSY